VISQEDPAFAEMDWQEEEMGVQTTEAARIGAALLALNGRITRIEALLAKDERPEPEDAGDRRAMSENFTAYRERIAGLPERGFAEVGYAGRVGMIPAPLADEIEGGLPAKEPAMQVAAAKRFTLVGDQLPAPCPEEVFTFVPCARATALLEATLHPQYRIHLSMGLGSRLVRRDRTCGLGQIRTQRVGGLLQLFGVGGERQLSERGYALPYYAVVLYPARVAAGHFDRSDSGAGLSKFSCATRPTSSMYAPI